ncbi:MAG: redoxin domain-containing protein [Gemmatimonadetes bacterium]|nr:redoxin domain-containing protein [Gemmatimonadota bacterium]
MTAIRLLAPAAAAFVFAGPLSAQQQQAAQPTTPPLEVGAVAPDFEIPGATRFGALRDPVKLSDFKGKTVVLAFFFRARTRG